MLVTYVVWLGSFIVFAWLSDSGIVAFIASLAVATWMIPWVNRAR
jgi:hypothetical protein